MLNSVSLKRSLVGRSICPFKLRSVLLRYFPAMILMTKTFGTAFIRRRQADSGAAIPPEAAPGAAGARARLREVRRARALRGGRVPANQNRESDWRCGSRVRHAGACRKIRRGRAISNPFPQS